MRMRRYTFMTAITASLALFAGSAVAQHDVDNAAQQGAPSGSLMARSLRQSGPGPAESDYHALRARSMFAVPPPKPREFAEHDLVQIIVRETSNVRSEQSLETEKEYDLSGAISKWPAFSLPELLELQLRNSESTPVQVDLGLEKEFEGEGEYERKEDFTARLTAEVIEILPNGNLVLEARTRIQTDEEITTIKVTGICRAEDVTIANTILSNQLHDLAIDKMHKGELKRSSEKGVIARVLDALFAF